MAYPKWDNQRAQQWAQQLYEDNDKFETFDDAMAYVEELYEAAIEDYVERERDDYIQNQLEIPC